ncbi:hypothetical protein, partial [Lysobacter panacisoli]|uniref:hypothetical protein n=1 Tax=Lysobacter panacisoli TaxID=1255263 RepID=UPI001E302A93
MMLPLPSLAPRNDFGSPSPTILAGRSAGHAAVPRALASMMLPLPSLAPRNDFGSPSPTILAGRSAGHAAMPR